MTKDTRWVVSFTLFCLLAPIALALSGCDSDYPPVPDDYQASSAFSSDKVDGSKLNHLLYQEHQDNIRLMSRIASLESRPQTDAARGSFGALA